MVWVRGLHKKEGHSRQEDAVLAGENGAWSGRGLQHADWRLTD
jgi:hypothetical protein